MSTPENRPLNVSYLVVGLIFLGIAGSWALRASDVIGSSDVQWLIPLVLVGAGAIGLVAFTAKGLTRGRGGAVRLDEQGLDEPGLDLYGDEPYETEQTSQTDHTLRIEGEDR
jgi:hypothetical protein